jgi:hypothetical protein
MDGAGQPRKIPLKAKYRDEKPKGKYRASYMGNSGTSRHKHQLMPMVPGIKRKRLRRRVY